MEQPAKITTQNGHILYIDDSKNQIRIESVNGRVFEQMIHPVR